MELPKEVGWLYVALPGATRFIQAATTRSPER